MNRTGHASAHRPALPIPPPLRGSEYGSFAYHTVTGRLPRIARRVLAENDFPPQTVARLEQLLDELPHGAVRPLQDGPTVDGPAWQAYVAPYAGQDWLAVPWFFAESYFYRRILEATGYFAPQGNHLFAGRDPFAPHKAQSLAGDWQEITELAARLAGWRSPGGETAAERAPQWTPELRARPLRELFLAALWGNQGDLSMWPAGGEQPQRPAEEGAVLIDDTRAVVEHLEAALARSAGAGTEIHLLVDNAAFELAGDLALGDFLLDAGVAARVVFHLKAHPVFVSDALPADVVALAGALAGGETEPLRAWGRRIRDAFAADRLLLETDYFWTSPLAAWKMPEALRRRLAAADLVISKGDANYRRLLGDRHWAYTAPFAAAVSYFPAPLLALRTLKSEVIAGLEPQQVAALRRSDPGWLTGGRRGLIQFVG